MESLKETIKKMSHDQSPIVVWLKGGDKIFGRVKSLEDTNLIIDVTGEMSEFQSYSALILLEQIAAIAWVIPRD
jgi:small nuclear ribonucleoprotein (snRNP)-like protein